MPILCEPQASAHQLMSAIGGEVQVAYSLNAVAEMLDSDRAETLVVLGPSVEPFDALSFTEMLRMERPTVGVILARETVDNTLLIQALQAGVREVVPAADRAALSAACYRSRNVSARLVETTHTPPSTEHNGKVITVFAPKGGAGKTTLALNLAIALAETTQERVCVIDLDLSFGEVAISVGLDPARTLVDAVPMAGHVDPTGAESLLTNYRPGLDMLLAPVRPGDAEQIPASLVGELLAVLRTMYGYIVIDTPAALTEHVLTALDASDCHVLLATPEIPALKNLRVALDTLDLLHYPPEIRSVVLNRAGSKVGLGKEQLEKVLRVPITAHIPSGRQVPVALNKGVPIILDKPRHQVSRVIYQFAQQLVAAPRRQMDTSPPPRHAAAAPPQPRGPVSPQRAGAPT